MKDFDLWGKYKKAVEKTEEIKLFHEREVWWCVLGLNIGSEQDGKGFLFQRPVLVVKKFNNRVLWVVPITHTHKMNPYYYLLPEWGDGASAAVLSQLKLISNKRLIRKFGVLPVEEFDNVIEKLKHIFPISKQNETPP